MITAITAILGALFTAGGIAAWFYWPILLPFVKPILSVLEFIFEYRVTVGALCLLVGLIAGDIHGQRTELAKWQAADLQAKLAAQTRDAAIAKAAAAEAQQLADGLNTKAKDLATKVANYEATLSNNAVCRATLSDVQRLQPIR